MMLVIYFVNVINVSSIIIVNSNDITHENFNASFIIINLEMLKILVQRRMIIKSS